MAISKFLASLCCGSKTAVRPELEEEERGAETRRAELANCGVQGGGGDEPDNRHQRIRRFRRQKKKRRSSKTVITNTSSTRASIKFQFLI